MASKNILGTLLDSNNVAIANATLRFISTSTRSVINSIITEYHTDNLGAYNFEVLHGIYTIQIKRSDEVQFRTVCANAYVYDTNPETLEALIRAQSHIKELNEDLIQEMLSILAQANAAAATSVVKAQEAADSAEDAKAAEIAAELSASQASQFATDAQTSANHATQSETNAAASATLAGEKASQANSHAIAAQGSAALSSEKAQEASASATNSLASANAAQGSASAAAAEASEAAKSEANAAASANLASEKAEAATTSATNAAASASTAATKAQEAKDAAIQATSASSSATDTLAAVIIEASKADASAKAAASSATSSAASATVSEGFATTATSKANEAALSAEAAAVSAALAAGALIEAGSANLSSGVYPAPIMDAQGNSRSCFWKVTVGGTVDGETYGIGDSLVYSKEIAGYYKIDNTEAVTSVAGKQGVVLLVPSDVGLGNVNNTSDLSKPISTATQTALDSKVPTTRTVNGKALTSNISITASDLGLGNVNNTSDLSKPISTATQSALDTKVPTTRTVNGKPLSGDISITASDLGLGSVNNTSDLNKPISTATQTALDSKVPTTRTVNGKPLSSDIALTNSDVGAPRILSNTIEIPSLNGGATGCVKIQGSGTDTEAWMTTGPNSDSSHRAIGINHGLGPVYWNGAAKYNLLYSGPNNLRNGSGFGAGFLADATAGAPWIAGYFGDAAGTGGRVVLGTLSGGGTPYATIGAHNAGLSAWDTLAINPAGSAPVYIGMYPDQSSGSGNLFVGNDIESNYIRIRSAVPNDNRYVVNKGYVDGKFAPIAYRENWADKGIHTQTAFGIGWRNYGNGHIVTDASSGNIEGISVPRTDAQTAWDNVTGATLVGWNGQSTFGVRVDRARLADAAYTSDRITGTVATNGQDLTIHGKRAVVGDNANNQLVINYGNDWGTVNIVGSISYGSLIGGHVTAVGSGNDYAALGVETRGNGATNTVFPGIGFHQPGIFAGSLQMRNADQFWFYKQGASERADVVVRGLYARDNINIEGTSSLYFSTYGGGWYMADSTWIRAANNKQIYTGSTDISAIHTAGGVNAVGDVRAGGQMLEKGVRVYSPNNPPPGTTSSAKWTKIWSGTWTNGQQYDLGRDLRNKILMLEFTSVDGLTSTSMVHCNDGSVQAQMWTYGNWWYHMQWINTTTLKMINAGGGSISFNGVWIYG